MKCTLVALTTTALVLATAACGTSEPSQAQQEDADASDAAAAGGPVTLTDDVGRTVELPAPAERVVVLEWQQVELVLSLGVEPVGVSDVEGYNTWDTAEPLDPEVPDVGLRGEPNMQAVFEEDPDLIIASVTGPSDALIKRFEKYDVPVLATTGADAEDPIAKMEANFRLVAEALGKEAEADEVMADFEDSLAEAEQQVAEADLAGTEFVYMDAYVQGSTLSVRPFGQGSLVGELGEAIGLTNVWEGEVDALYGLGQTDLEGITSVNADWLFYTGTERDTWYDAVEGNPLWDNASFVENDQVAAFPDGIWTFGGPRSSEQILDAYVSSLTS